MQTNFIKVVAGKNSWKRYLSSLLVILTFLFLGSIMYVAAMGWYAENDESSQSYFDFEEGTGVNVDPVVDFAFSHSTYVLWFLGLFIAMRIIHKRSLLSLVTPYSKLNWSKIGWGFAIYFLLIVGFNLLDFALSPEDYELNNIEVNDFLKLFLLVLIFTPLQTTCEELFFRGYLMQWFGKRINNVIFLSLVVGMIFAVLHFGNPEMEYSAFFVGSDYVLSGVMWCYISAKTNSSELTIGAHAANNMFLGWFLTMDDSVFGNIPSLFLVKSLDPRLSLLWSIIILSIFTYFALKKFGPSDGV